MTELDVETQALQAPASKCSARVSAEPAPLGLSWCPGPTARGPPRATVPRAVRGPGGPDLSVVMLPTAGQAGDSHGRPADREMDQPGRRVQKAGCPGQRMRATSPSGLNDSDLLSRGSGGRKSKIEHRQGRAPSRGAGEGALQACHSASGGPWACGSRAPIVTGCSPSACVCLWARLTPPHQDSCHPG